MIPLPWSSSSRTRGSSSPTRARSSPSPAALELLDRGGRGDHRQHARLAGRVRHRRAGAAGRSSSATGGTCSSAARDRARRTVLRTLGLATVFFGRLLPVVRTFISFPAGVARMPIGRFIVYLDARRLPLVASCSSGSASSWARTGRTSAQAPAVRRLIAGGRHRLVVAFIWWRIGMPGRRRRAVPTDTDSER